MPVILVQTILMSAFLLSYFSTFLMFCLLSQLFFVILYPIDILVF